MAAKKTQPPKTKRTVIVHKKDIKVDNIFQLLSVVENNIQELNRMYAELPGSNHRDVGGRMKPTTKQIEIAKQIKSAQARADRLMRIIEKQGF
ncbi:MAG: hypothetical protein P9M13_07025 [Candidatus Ancaeobacter aquaticus]|nr:hypothetical protein [Candidatus Ancaeobacter aquaticus]